MSDPIEQQEQQSLGRSPFADLKAHWKAQREKANERVSEVLAEGIANIVSICAEGVAETQLAKISEALGFSEMGTLDEVLAGIATLRVRLVAVEAVPRPWMVEQGLAPWPSGDAAKANGPYFQLWSNVERTRLAILCPTLLRGPLTIRCDRVHHISY